MLVTENRVGQVRVVVEQGPEGAGPGAGRAYEEQGPRGAGPTGSRDGVLEGLGESWLPCARWCWGRCEDGPGAPGRGERAHRLSGLCGVPRM